jgi:hypothetical protein
MLHLLVYGFWVSLALFTIGTCVVGGASERWAAGMMCLAGILTPVIGDAFDAHWRRPEPGVLAVDIALLVGLLILALRSRRFWPMTVASLQLIAVLTHPALWLDPRILPLAYAFMQGFWAYPMMAIVIIGAVRHWQRHGDEGRTAAFVSGDAAHSS